MPKSFIRIKKILPLLLLSILGTHILAGCSKSDDQKEFENQALNLPQDYTTADENGNITDEDSNDWRISPIYAGLVRVEIPAHPNPVVGDRFEIDIFISGIDAIPSGRMEFFIINSVGEQIPLAYSVENVTTGLTSIPLSRSQIPGISSSEIAGLYRLVISDGRNNFITYGDIKIE